MTTKEKRQDDWLDADYQLPSSSSYMKLMPGDNKFRILSQPVTGYEFWTGENKAIRSRDIPKETPGIKVNKEGKSSVNHFWAMIVYNYNAKDVQILQLTQKGIMKYILELKDNPDWGSPLGYDIKVNRTGSGLETKYTTVASPHSDLNDDIKTKFTASDLSLDSFFDDR